MLALSFISKHASKLDRKCTRKRKWRTSTIPTVYIHADGTTTSNISTTNINNSNNNNNNNNNHYHRRTRHEFDDDEHSDDDDDYSDYSSEDENRQNNNSNNNNNNNGRENANTRTEATIRRRNDDFDVDDDYDDDYLMNQEDRHISLDVVLFMESGKCTVWDYSRKNELFSLDLPEVHANAIVGTGVENNYDYTDVRSIVNIIWNPIHVHLLSWFSLPS